MSTAMAERVRGGGLPDALRTRYGSDLEIPLAEDRPTFVANFVTTLDGVVTFDPASGKGGGEVSGFFEPDRFVMGVLRSLADVVLIGAGTVRSDPRGRWTPASIHPSSSADFADLRSQLDLAPQPTTAVITASGDLSFEHPGLSDPDIPVLVITSEAGSRRVDASGHPRNVEIQVAGDERVEMTQLQRVLGDRGAQLVLCEGGPRLFGELLDARLVDELFLTIAPQIAGREQGDSHVSLVEGRSFDVARAPWADLVDARPVGSHLFTRYRFRRSSI